MLKSKNGQVTGGGTSSVKTVNFYLRKNPVSETYITTIVPIRSNTLQTIYLETAALQTKYFEGSCSNQPEISKLY